MSTGVQRGVCQEQYFASPPFLSFWGELMPRIQPLLFENGGPVVAVQLENELGYFGADMGTEQVAAYLSALVAMARRHLGQDVLLYTADPPQGIKQGSLPGHAVLRCAVSGTHVCASMKQLPSALNFWATSDEELQAHFAQAAQMNPAGHAPRFVAEF